MSRTNVPSSRRWWTLSVVALAQLMVVLDSTVVNIALPSAQADLGFSNGDRQWIVTAYSLAFASLLLLGGRLSDLIGRKRTFIIGLIGFAIASALGGAAGTFGWLVAARALQGAFGALLAPTALAVLTTTFTIPKERARAFGVFGAIAGAGGAVGLLLGGFLTEYFDWRWNLYINVVIAIVGVIGAAIFVDHLQRTGPRPKLDIPGTILVSAALFGLVFGFSNAETDGWDSPLTWGMLAGAVVLLVAFVLWQRKAAHPLLPLQIVLDRNRGAAYLSVMIAGAGMFGIFLFVTYYLQTSLGFTPMQTGFSFLPMIAMLVLAAQLSTNIFVPRFGPKVMVPFGMALGATGMILLTNLNLDSTYAANVLPPLMILGFAMGSIMPASMQTATLGVDRQFAGVASAMVNTSQQVGGSIGTALLNTLAATAAADYVASHLPATAEVAAQAAVTSYAVAYWWGAGFFAVGGIIAALLFRRMGHGLSLSNAHLAAETEPVVAR
ncbi:MULTISPECIES: MFS transporter [unclassified Cryobacterium]|uniref:MFS transporter n=1 Tax=unclassified Cryobacterium TaxID=2649013 RepID=UPI00106920AB|nr:MULTISPECIES: MFS transporter [unclassified Cryobacterium]TFC55262.1 DHA2 family efflux MFS transporter permease subunit [Cryobacterium sp. TMB3-1-2]TFC71137.1 DHA2 family efflux MFS transporter permease subunit [Cryobacterium sp. TMB3-15]TFC77047.1 DHA2 family efflux MFS transporter permease subunit [Cryobacterium sp. TMB3-10]TFD46730.1 DHA2 family efflux MFS transporter permease subunit [Cryobacterium sp. TMB3-12]